MRRIGLSFVAVLVAMAFTLPVHATWWDMSLPTTVTTEIGSTVEIPITVDTLYHGGSHLDFVITTNPTQLEIVSLTPGDGLREYMDTVGMPTLFEVIVTAGMISVDAQFFPGYDSGIYGGDFMRMTCVVTATVPGSTTVSATGTWMDAVSSTVIIEQGEDPFIRGDVNGDAVCDLTDAVSLLDVLFTPGTTLACADAGDLNDNGQVVLTDVVMLLHQLFVAGVPMEETCAHDSAADSLPPCEYDSCP